MAQDASFATGSLLAGKYRVLDLLGQGGMGAVYLAENVDIGRQVAIKVLKPELAADPNSLARFRQEARAAASIGHPGIVEILDMGMLPEGGAFIVMERLEGMTLRDRLAREGSLFPPDAVALVAPVLDTLAAAHDKGVIHRDLKPDNIFLVETPVPGTKILDFGISKFRGTGDVALTRTGMVMGTPLYMSPEQARGAKDVGVTADLYSIGAILFEALSGQPPFPGESYNEVLAKVLMDTARPVSQMRPDVPPELEALIAALLSKDPNARPQTARDTAAALRASVPADFVSQAVAPRGTSSTFIRPTPPPQLAGPRQTGPRPPSAIDATYTPPPRTQGGSAWKPPTSPPPANPLPETHIRPPNPGANQSTQPPVMDAIAVAPPPKSSKAPTIVGITIVALVAVAIGIRMGKRETLKELAKDQVERSAPSRPPTKIEVHAGDDGLEVQLPSGKVKVDDQGIHATATTGTNAVPDAGAVAEKAPTPVAEPPEPPKASHHSKHAGYKVKKPAKGGIEAPPGFN